ncbi:hypothetical protein BC829DRAFT_108255 [Chytridium lagenaria]|nr:hypothetical protein BC829DRAFT_108255 [Chytridium lagenaria]
MKIWQTSKMLCHYCTQAPYIKKDLRNAANTPSKALPYYSYLDQVIRGPHHFFFASVFPLGVGDQLPTTTFISFATFCFDFLGTPRKLEGSTWMSQLFRAIGRHLLDVSSAPNKEAVISASASLSMLIIRKFAADLNGDKAFFTTIKVFVEVLEATASLLPSTGKLPPGLCDIIFIVLYAKKILSLVYPQNGLWLITCS